MESNSFVELTNRLFRFLFYLGVVPVLFFYLLPAPMAGEADQDEKKKTQIAFTMPLDHVLKHNKTGIQLEGHSKEELEHLKRMVKKFVQYRRNTIKPEDFSSLVSECLLRSEDKVFCEYLSEDWAKENLDTKDDKEGSQKTRKTINEIRAHLEAAEIDELSDVSYSRLTRSVRRWKSWSRLEKISTEIQDDDDCVSVNLLTTLGSKAEEYFPDPKFRKLSDYFYSKVDECAEKKTRAVDQARFRLGLLKIWDNQCPEARKILRKIDYRNANHETRAKFWRAWCAKQEGDKLAFNVLKNKLLKMNPLAYHSITISEGRPINIMNLAKSKPTLVQLRSFEKTELNPAIRMVELLQMVRENRFAGEFLDWVIVRVRNAEAPLKAYIAVLARRNNWYIRKFQLLSRIFREDARLISEEALKLFYPLLRFNLLKKHKRKVDPYFLASLIRQESGFMPNARSRAGAMGLMQLMPATVRRMQRRVSRWQLLKPHVNVRLGARFLRKLLDRYEGDAELALAAYNAGAHRVKDWVARYPVKNRMLFLDLIPFQETRRYVSLIGRNFFWYLNLYAPNHLELIRQDSGGASRSIASSRKKGKIYFSAFGN